MPADSSIFQQYLQPVRSVQDYGADLDKRNLLALQLQGQQGQNALLDITRQQQAEAARQGIEKQSALRQLYANPEAADPIKREELALRNPLTYEHGQGLRKERLANDETSAKTLRAQGLTPDIQATTEKVKGETAEAAVKRYSGMLPYIDTPQAAARWLSAQYEDPSLQSHMAAMGPLDAAVQSIPRDPQGFAQWRQQAGMGMEAYAKKVQEDAKIAETARNNRATDATSKSNNAANNATSRANNRDTQAGENLRAAAARAQALNLANRGVVHDTDAGTSLIDPRTGKAQLVVDSGTGQPLGKPLKSLPPAVNDAIIGNAQSLYTLNKAIALLDGKQVDSANGDAAATGWKGYLPQAVLNRIDPSGVDTRAEVADIGSLKIHDRSGAAVTISESPRLMPFIPQATDPPDVAKRKLTRLLEEAQRNQQALSDTYSKEQGYKPSPVKPQPTQAAPASGGNTVNTPDGKAHTFPNPAAAAAFKKAAGL